MIINTKFGGNSFEQAWKSCLWHIGRGFANILICSFLCVDFFSPNSETLAQETAPCKDLTETLIHEDIKRTYHIHLPAGFSKQKKSPLVIALHGGGGQGSRLDQSLTDGTLSAAADKKSVVLVCPEGIDRRWNDGREINTDKTYDDVGFISAIIDRMVESYGVDHERVYATGISNGGFMSIRLSVGLSHKFAAVAPVAAQLAKALGDKTPKLPISIMIINGTKDPLVPFGGGHIRLFRFGRSRGEILSTEATIEHFRRHNGCSKTPEISKLEDRAPDDGAQAEVVKYIGGKDGTEVILVKVVGGGHTWPGGKQYLRAREIGPVCRDFDASEIILDFFLRHSRKERSAR